ncbi:hypothetical protein SteCoe_4477 [Stentor coeruleus]|uniref:EamA domain-containing protein n=1 Tax=Stentor coeruleus TaxID=5963 RepID=A0A1R2CUM4_9CILI|nr:hypothetical protein SteCoe_4477 [Stentor coeruleus]
MILCIFTTRRINDIFLQWNKKHLFLCFLSGFIGVFCAQLSFCLGLKTSDARFTSPWMLLNPIFTTILGLLLGYEKFKKLKTIGLSASLLATGGLIILKASTSEVGTIYKPTCFLFISSLSNATAVIIWRKLLVEYKLSSLIVTAWSLIVGSIFMIIAYILEPYWFNQVAFHDLTTSLKGCLDILACCFTIMLGYGITYAILTWATHKSSISIVALYASARPLFTVVLSFIINKDKPWITATSVILLGIIFYGLILSSYSKKKEKNAKLNQKIKEKEQWFKSIFARPVSGKYELLQNPRITMKVT